MTFGSEEYEPLGENHLHVVAITKKEQQEFFGNPGEYKKTFYNITWDPSDEHWQLFNERIIKWTKENITERAIFGTFAGVCQQQVAQGLPSVMTVEVGIGYTGVFSPYKVFESNAWMHYVYGLTKTDNGNFYDTVINNYWDISEFPLAKKTGDYYLYVGRLIDRKGYHIAQQVCEHLGKRLILAGQMDKGQEFEGYGEYIGTVDVAERGKLMSEAIAVFTPTKYIGPFEGVHVEAMLCGTPVITTDFGVYTETVTDTRVGYRCSDFSDFLAAAEWVTTLNKRDRRFIQNFAQARWDMNTIKYQYDAYFKRLMKLYTEKGWYNID